MDGVANDQEKDVAGKLQALRDAVELPVDRPDAEASGIAPALTPSSLERLSDKWQVQERPFSSGAPVIGPLVVWFRRTWNNISTTWYVRSLLQQQNEFNNLVVRQLTAFDMINEELDSRLTSVDRDGTMLARQVAESTYALSRIEHRLAQIEKHLDASRSNSS